MHRAAQKNSETLLSLDLYRLKIFSKFVMYFALTVYQNMFV